MACGRYDLAEVDHKWQSSGGGSSLSPDAQAIGNTVDVVEPTGNQVDLQDCRRVRGRSGESKAP